MLTQTALYTITTFATTWIENGRLMSATHHKHSNDKRAVGVLVDINSGERVLLHRYALSPQPRTITRPYQTLAEANAAVANGALE